MTWIAQMPWSTCHSERRCRRMGATAWAYIHGMPERPTWRPSDGCANRCRQPCGGSWRDGLRCAAWRGHGQAGGAVQGTCLVKPHIRQADDYPQRARDRQAGTAPPRAAACGAVDHPWIPRKPELARQLVREGFYLSVGERFNRDSLAEIPAERLLLESDDSAVDVREIARMVGTGLRDVSYLFGNGR